MNEAICWKTVSASPGYRSLKKEYNRCAQRWEGRDKEYSRRVFKWTIRRAMHYAHHRNSSLVTVLDDWEMNRTANWQSYYTARRFPKLNVKPCHSRKPLKIIRRQYRTHQRILDYEGKLRLQASLTDLQRNMRKYENNKKPRYTTLQKSRIARYRRP